MKKRVLKRSLALFLTVLLATAAFVPTALAAESYPMDIHPDTNYTNTDHITAGGTVYLTKDEFPKEDIHITKNTVLDLGGRSITGHYYEHKENSKSTDQYIVMIYVDEGANVTIRNGTLKDIRVLNNSGGTLTLSNVKFDVSGYAQIVQNDSNATLRVENCSYTATEDNRFIWNGGTIEHIRNCTVTIPDAGGYFEDVISNNGIIRTIDGLSITAPCGWYVYNYDSGTVDQIKNCSFVMNGKDIKESAYGNYCAIGNEGTIGSITNATVATSGFYGVANEGTIDTITGCTLTNGQGEFSSILNRATIGTISNTSIKSEAYMALNNFGTIDTITGCTMTALGEYGSLNNEGTIKTLSGCTMYSNRFVTNYKSSTIGTISGCTMKAKDGEGVVLNFGTIDLIPDCYLTAEKEGAFIVASEGEIKTIRNTLLVAPKESYVTTEGKGKIGTNHSGATDKEFADVPRSAYYMPAVYWAKGEGVTTGRTETTFDPNATCTRGEVATFLWRAMGQPEPKTKENPFTDISESDYYYKPILWAVEQGITNGISDTTFSPNQTCSNAHIITFLWRAMKSPGKTGMDPWYADAENWAKGQALLEQTAAAANISGNCLRGDVVTFLYRVLSEEK